MNRKIRVLFLIVVLCLTTAVFPVNANQTITDEISQNEQIFWLTLEMPLLDANGIYDINYPKDAERYASDLINRQSALLKDELNQLQSQGIITEYKFLPESQSFEVHSVNPEAISSLKQLSGLQMISSSPEPNTCGMNSFNALKEQVLGISQAHERTIPQESKSSTPSILVQYTNNSSLSYIFGVTAASVEVNLRILRAGQLIAEKMTTSGSNGSYWIYPDYDNCLYANGYEYVIQAGDVVEVSAAGSTVSTVVAKLDFWVDPFNNIVQGITDPGKKVDIYVLPSSGSFCNEEPEIYQQIISNGDGTFSADFSSQKDFKGRSIGFVYIFDGNGNGTTSVNPAYFIGYYSKFEQYFAYVKPNSTYIVELKRLNTIIDHITGVSDSRGYLSGYFSPVVQAGDVISVQAGGRTLSYLVEPLTNYYLDAETNQFSGFTGTGVNISGRFYRRDSNSGAIQTSCFYDYTCINSTSLGDGSFVLSAGLDLLKGDTVEVGFIDDQGNYQFVYDISSSAIQADWQNYRAQGYWYQSNTPLTVTLINTSDQVVKTINTTSAFYDSSFFVDFDDGFSPGYKISVTDGIRTETMTVASIGGQLYTDTGMLTIGGSNGFGVLNFNSFDRTTGYSSSSCTEVIINSSQVNISYPNVGGRDSADILFRGADGNYTRYYAHAYGLGAIDSNYVYGYTLSPLQNVEIKHYRGAALLEILSTASGSTGLFSGFFSNSFIAGDVIQAVSGASYQMTIPNLTINLDIPMNRLYGNSPASEPIQLSIWKDYLEEKGGWYATRVTKIVNANSSGMYSAIFDEMFYRDCSQVSLSGQCRNVQSISYDQKDNSYGLNRDFSDVITPDSWEIDNFPADAKLYTTIQSHTIHDEYDEDWIKINIASSDLGKLFYLQTVNLGPLMDTVMALYDTDGTTLIASNDDASGYASEIMWIPNKTGTFYVKITPYNWVSGGTCGSTYDFMISHEKVFLPLVTK